MTTATYTFEKKELKAGEAFSFEKEIPNQTIQKVFMGLGWDAAKEGQNIDLDANASLLDKDGNEVSVVFFQNKESSCGSVKHSGDDLTGQNSEDGDDEQITVDLTKVPANVEAIVFSVASYSGQSFKDISRSFCRLVDNTSGEVELCNLVLAGESTGNVMAKLQREGASWKFVAINESIAAKTVQDVRAYYGLALAK